MDQELMCRICFTKTTRCVSVFTEPKLWNKAVSLYRMIMACAPVEISANDGLPSKICETCLTKLQYSFLFRIQILQADIKLRNHARKTRVAHSSSVIEDSLPEPILTDTKSNMQQIYSLDQILQSVPQLRNALNSSDNELFNKSAIKNELKTEPVIEEVIVIPDEDMEPLKIDNQVCSVDSKKVSVEEIVKCEANTVFCNENNHSNSPLPNKTVTNSDNVHTKVNEYNEIQNEHTSQISSGNLTVTCNKTGVSNDIKNISTSVTREFIEEVIVIPDEDMEPLKTDNQVCSVDSNEIPVEEVVRCEANTVFSNENNRSNSPLPNKTVTNSDNVHTKVNEYNEIQNEHTSQISSGNLTVTYNKTGVINIIKNISTSDVLSTQNCNSSNLITGSSPLNNTAQSIPINNIAVEKIDQIKTISDIEKSLKTNILSKHEISLTNQTIRTCTQADKNTPLPVQTIVNTVTRTANIRLSQEKKLVALVEPYKNLTIQESSSVNESEEIQNKQKPNKNSDDSKSLSKKINLNSKLTPGPSYVLGQPCTSASKDKINSAFYKKNCTNLMELVKGNDLKPLVTKTMVDSDVKLYKLPKNTTKSLQEPSVVNCRKQGNNAIIPDKSTPKNVKLVIVSFQPSNETLANKIGTHPKSTSSKLLQSVAISSSFVQKNTNNSTAINIENSCDLKRKAEVKVYVNKRKKSNISENELTKYCIYSGD